MENKPKHPPYKVYRRINGDERGSIIGEAKDEKTAIAILIDYAQRDCFEVTWKSATSFQAMSYLNGSFFEPVWIDAWVEKGE